MAQTVILEACGWNEKMSKCAAFGIVRALVNNHHLRPEGRRLMLSERWDDGDDSMVGGEVRSMICRR
jgi:hypothetical protein